MIYLLVFEAQEDDLVQEGQVRVRSNGRAQVSLAGILQDIITPELALHKATATDTGKGPILFILTVTSTFVKACSAHRGGQSPWGIATLHRRARNPLPHSRHIRC